MGDVEGTQVTFLDQTGAKSVKAKISPTVTVAKMIPSIITKMMLPTTSPDGTPMSYSLDHKEGGRRLQETQTLPDAGVKDGDHLIVYPEIVAGATMKITILLAKDGGEEMPWVIGAWDEYSIDANEIGFYEAVDQGKKSHDDFRTAVIEVPADFMRDAFKPIKVQGKPVEGGA
jgi:hypothetical protein